MALDDTRIGEIAERNGFDAEAGRAMAEALRSGGGGMAQFTHPALGGMGQWSRGGMLMIGSMNDHALKARVGALASELAAAMGETEGSDAGASEGAGKAAPKRSDSPWARDESDGGGGGAPARSGGGGGGDWWPGDLGRPGSSGAQNGVRYAVFPQARRLAIERNGRVEVRDTGDHRIGGVSQSQGGSTALRFTSQHGDVDLESLPEA